MLHAHLHSKSISDAKIIQDLLKESPDERYLFYQILSSENFSNGTTFTKVEWKFLDRKTKSSTLEILRTANAFR